MLWIIEGMGEVWSTLMEVKIIRRALLSGVLILATFLSGLGQETPDPARNPNWLKKQGSQVVKKLMGAITVDPVDETPAFNEKSETAYLPYGGKIIRKIIIKRIGFERTILDTARNFQTFISKAANNLHVDTKEFVIRDNLFIKEGKPLNPYRVADNERTLRNLNFILDSRILVKPISKTSDSVDLIIITKDVFSFGGILDAQGPTRYKVGVQEANLAGMGQRIQFNTLVDAERSPNIGIEAIYQKINVAGSFVDATVGYSRINTGTSIGNENEDGVYLRLNRPLFQPFARWAGGLELSKNQSVNAYMKPDSTFARYDYSIQDYWAGYSFGHSGMSPDLKENRNRKFIAVRAFQQHFQELPTIDLTEPDFYAYRNRTSILTQLTFFRQDFYKTQYVIGFGRTEDIPHGYRTSFTSGWETEMGFKRAYLGSEGVYTRVLENGSILTYSGKLATYIDHGNYQDGLLAFDFTRYSQLYQRGTYKIRYQVQAGAAWLFNQTIKRGIDIRDINGILGFAPDSLVGTKRLTVSQEAVVFTQSKVLGFRLAPVARLDLAFINNKNTDLLRGENFFAGLSAGLRARNENLIFNTIEARVIYYPKVIEGIDHIQFSVGTNIRIKYSSNLVNPPSTVFNR
ncbi:hypothetical protein BH09BAC3_BH09BAC3_31660 [soil metagenome]